MTMLDVTVGSDVVRYISSARIAQPMKVTLVDEQFIHCGPWKFLRTNGVEVDEELWWTGEPNAEGVIHTGSVIEVTDGH